jgi:hypothetical protein
MHLFHLPGDIVIDRPGFKFFFPITTMLIVSVVLSIIAWLARRVVSAAVDATMAEIKCRA